VSGLDYASIGKRIRFYRMQRNLSQEELASRIPVSRTYLGYLETGARTVGLESLVRIANELGVSIEVLLEDSLEETSDLCDTRILRVLIDCTPQEAAILMTTISGLKRILKGFTIR
jgi:transcriptional regulator with XRE-family HTH domain